MKHDVSYYLIQRHRADLRFAAVVVLAVAMLAGFIVSIHLAL